MKKSKATIIVKTLLFIIIVGSFALTLMYFIMRGKNDLFDIKLTDVLVAQVFSTCSLMVSGLLTQQYTIDNNRLHDYHEIITKETRANNLYVRENVSRFLTLSNPIVIESMKEDKEYVRRIVECKFNLLAHFKIIVEQEVELIKNINLICDKAIKYHHEASKKNKTDLEIITKKFYYLYSWYDYSDWRYIKEHAKEITIQDISDWDKIYKELETKFEDKKNELNNIIW